MDNFYLKNFTIISDDNLLLPSLYYFGKKKVDRLAIYIHGAGSASIVRNPTLNNALANSLVSNGIDLLTFNNRGSGYITKFNKVDGSNYLGGMCYERIADFHKDINGVIKWAKKQGYKQISLIGHSTGANKIIFELSHHRQPLVDSICLLGGGDDITLQQGRYTQKDLKKLIKKIDQQVLSGKGNELVPNKEFVGGHPISWGSLKELLTPFSDYDIFSFGNCSKENNNEYFKEIRTINIPIEFIYGSDDFGTIIKPKDAVDFLTSINQNSTGNIINNADHNFKGKEKELARIITEWLGRTEKG